MGHDELAPVDQIDAVALQRAVARAGGPALELVEPLAGGAVGAWLVRWPDGHLGVLTWAPPIPPGQPPEPLRQAMDLMAIAREAGLPVPRYEAVIDVGKLGAAIIQERAPGHVPGAITPGLVQRLLDLTELRRGLLAGTAFEGRPMPLYLTESGPWSCLHESLRAYSARSAALADAIRATAGGEDYLVGADLVHYDYHLGNVLVDPEDPSRITAVLDWDGARPGSVAIDLAILAFDLTRRSPGHLQAKVEAQLLASTDPAQVPKVWAHAALRLVDWAIRHHEPEVVGHWLAVGEAHVPVG